MTKKEAETLLKEWDEIETLWVENDKKREEVYKEALRSCDSRQWVKLIKTSYQRNQVPDYKKEKKQQQVMSVICIWQRIICLVN